MSKPARYVPNHEGIREWASGPEMQAAMLAMAERGARYLRTIAPKVSGFYASRVAVTTAITRGGFKNEQRAGAIISATVPYATKLELKDGYHLLGRTATFLDGRHRWYAMTPQQRSGARRRASNRKRKRASSR